MASDRLFELLSQAKARPSNALRAVEAGGQAATDIMSGYAEGKKYRAGLQEQALKPYIIYADLVDKAGRKAADSIFKQAGMPIPTMAMAPTSTGIGLAENTDIPLPSSAPQIASSSPTPDISGPDTINGPIIRRPTAMPSEVTPAPSDTPDYGAQLRDLGNRYQNGEMGTKEFQRNLEMIRTGSRIPPAFENVMSGADALKAGKVPRGTKIVNSDGESVDYIGNDENGRPIGKDKKGKTTIIKLPAGSNIVTPKSSTMPTSSARTSGESADSLIPHIQEMRDLIQRADEKGYIGPGAGRLYGQFLSGQIGSTGDPQADELLANLRAIDTFLKSGAMKVHFGSRGGQQMYEHFSDILNSGKQSAAQLNGALNGIESILKGYSAAGKPGKRVQTSPSAQETPEEWLAKNPNHPLANAVRAKLKATQGVSNGGI